MLAFDMPLFLATLREPSEDHDVESFAGGFTIVRKAGRVSQFNSLAQRVLDRNDQTFTAFARGDLQGGYQSVQIIPRQ